MNYKVTGTSDDGDMVVVECDSIDTARHQYRKLYEADITEIPATPMFKNQFRIVKSENSYAVRQLTPRRLGRERSTWSTRCLCSTQEEAEQTKRSFERIEGVMIDVSKAW